MLKHLIVIRIVCDLVLVSDRHVLMSLVPLQCFLAPSISLFGRPLFDGNALWPGGAQLNRRLALREPAFLVG